MLRCNVLGGECCLMLLTPGRRFLRYRPPTVCSFVLGDQPSPRCEWSELIKPHRIIVSKSQRIISHPFEKYNVRFSFSPRPPSFCPRLAVPFPQSPSPPVFFPSFFLCLSLRFVPECHSAPPAHTPPNPRLPLPERESRGEEAGVRRHSVCLAGHLAADESGRKKKRKKKRRWETCFNLQLLPADLSW